MKHSSKVLYSLDGNPAYYAFLSKKEIEMVDSILAELQVKVPEMETGLRNIYGKTALYDYYLGKFLNGLIQKYGICLFEQNDFLEEIRVFATKDKTVKSWRYYDNCLILAEQDLQTVQKLTAGQWHEFFNKVQIHQEQRIYIWIKTHDGEIRGDDWHLFLQALTRYIQEYYIALSTDDEVLEIYDSIYAMCVYWRTKFGQYETDFPEVAGTVNRTQLRRKYLDNCFAIHRAGDTDVFPETIYEEAFERALQENAPMR